MDETLAFLAGLAGEMPDADDRRAAERLSVAARSGDAGGAAALLELARLVGEGSEPATLPDALDLAPPSDALSTIARLVAACFAAVRADYPSRQDAQASRARISARAEAAFAVAGGYGAETLAWLADLAGATVRHLSTEAGTRAPAVRVETGMSLPSTLIAYDLYGEAARAEELVNRNRLATPMVMPTIIEALAE